MPKQESWMVIILFLCLGFFFQYSRLRELPKTVHPWAQSDRYALALGFLNNDFNLLKPETYLMNREFPHNFKKAANNSITSVNLPLHEYFIAFIMKLVGSKSIGVFQLYNLFFSLIGLFALFKIGRIAGLSFLSALSIPLFLNLSPIFLIYQVSTLGVINTLSMVFLALYFYLLFRKHQKFKHFLFSISLFTLATLIRSTALIPFIAVILSELIRSLVNKNFYGTELVAILLAFGALWAHYYYMNLHMVYHYGSVFLYYLVPARDLAEMKEILQTAYDLWRFHYFSLPQWILLFLVFLTGSYLLFKQKKLSSRLTTLGLLALLSSGGYALFSIAMFTKFRHHDYYLLDTLYIPVFLLSILFVRFLETKLAAKKKLSAAFFLFLFVAFFMAGKNHQAKAIESKPWLNTEEVIQDYKAIAKKLDSLQIPKEAKVLIVGAENAPNLPLLLLDRKGYILRWRNKTEMQNVLNWKYDYLLFRKQHFFNHYYDAWPDFLNHFEVVDKSQEVVVAKASDSLHQYKKSDFISLGEYETWKSFSLDLKQPDEAWSGIIVNQESQGIVSNENEFALTFETKAEAIQNSSIWLQYSFELLAEDSLSQAEVNLAVIDRNGEVPLYKPFTLSGFIKVKDQWNKVEIIKQFEIPNGAETLKIYFWNRGKERFLYRKVELQLLKKRS